MEKMKTFLKNWWPALLIAALLIVFGLTFLIRPQAFALEPDTTEQTVKNLEAQIEDLSCKIDNAAVLLQKNDSTLGVVLSTQVKQGVVLKGFTVNAQANLDSLSVRFDREAAKETPYNALWKGIGL